MKALVTKKQKRVIVYDVIRVIAIILVLIGHATYFNITSPYGGVRYKGYNFADLYKFIDGPVKGIIYSFHMPLFIFLSGALFNRECSKNNNIFNLMNKYSFDIYILGDPLNYIVLFLVSSLSLTHLYSTTGGTIMLLLTRTVGIAVMSIIIAYIIEKLTKLKYFKNTIKVMIVLIIVLSCITIMYNHINDIELDSLVYEVIE